MRMRRMMKHCVIECLSLLEKVYYCFHRESLSSMFPVLHCGLNLAEENRRLGILAGGLHLAGLSQVWNHESAFWQTPYFPGLLASRNETKLDHCAKHSGPVEKDFGCFCFSTAVRRADTPEQSMLIEEGGSGDLSTPLGTLLLSWQRKQRLLYAAFPVKGLNEA